MHYSGSVVKSVYRVQLPKESNYFDQIKLTRGHKAHRRVHRAMGGGWRLGPQTAGKRQGQRVDG